MPPPLPRLRPHCSLSFIAYRITRNTPCRLISSVVVPRIHVVTAAVQPPMAPRLPLLLAAAAQLQLRLAASLATGGRTVARSARDFAAAVPALIAHGGECDLCGGHQQWLFILSAGQGGSTVLQEMLNAIPGFYIAGENFGVLNILLEEYEATGKIVTRSDRGEPGWQTRPISQRHLLCAMQTVMRNVIGTFNEGNASIIGFEETRHTSRRQLDFFRKAAPHAIPLLADSPKYIPPWFEEEHLTCTYI
ncbi:unnamed protein product [Prorocentrum cordatum]|uniref:Protein-tyrosine sulfotransferase n=2 Tax=Prorocentrum cordatum TaxID=2364126 RepID=A0ABN9T203_9DINO|nr:unnamed protein product [Polarella glacialis]